MRTTVAVAALLSLQGTRISVVAEDALRGFMAEANVIASAFARLHAEPPGLVRRGSGQRPGQSRSCPAWRYRSKYCTSFR